MKGTRWIILAALALIVAGSGYFYILEKRYAKDHRTEQPAILPPDTSSNAIDYEYAESSGGFASVQVKAKTYRQVGDTPNFELGGLELKLTQKDHQHYDLIKSASAKFNRAEGRMFAEGAVAITLDVPLTGTPLHPLTSITTSGVTFDSKTGKASTDRAAQFTFANGDGKCTGASYDPTTHQLHLLGSPAMNLRGTGSHSKPMQVQGGEITYNESGSVVYLTPWSRMVRAETTIEAGPSVVNLKQGHVDTIDAQQAHGVDQFPKRQLRYSADNLHVNYDENGEINKITGTGSARMHEESQGSVTDTRSRTAALDFSSASGESVLRHVLAVGDAVAESKPAADANGRMAESRILKSETIDVNMRPDGREIDQIKTQAAGTLEFLPNAPDQHRRILNGERMVIDYADKNLLKSYQAINTTTVTFPAASSKSKNTAPGKTASKMLAASFDARGQLAGMKQWDQFTYEEGDRRAKAATATLDQQTNTMDLETGARVWDTNGSTEADRIHLVQKTGDYVADGHVSTSRLPEQDPKKKQSGGMLDGDEPIQGSAPHMTSANHNKLVHYDDGAVLWQGSDRIQAHSLEIDRDKHLLTAIGQVTTQFLDQAKEKDRSKENETQPATATVAPITKVSAVAEKPAAPAAAAYTVVTSEKLVYTDTDRLAHYSGSVELRRPGLTVKSADLLAFLNPKDTKEDSRLNRAVGDGRVEIVDITPTRHRIGHGDHGEYFTSEDKVVLRGNLADLYDSVKKDESHGAELTYFTSDDRLLITGAASKPVDSRLHRKPRANANPGNR